MTAGDVTDHEQALRSIELDIDTPGSQPKPFSEAEKAWGAVLYQYAAGKFFTPHALRYPPKEAALDQQALALGLRPDASGQIMADRRAKRLIFYVRSLFPNERAVLAELAQNQFERWRLEQPAMGVVESSLELVQENILATPLLEATTPVPQPVTSGPSPKPGTTRPWKLPENLMLPSSGGESPEEVARQIVRLRQESDQMARFLQETLESFNVYTEIRPEDICIGPSVLRYGIRPTGIPLMKTDEKDKSQKVIVRDGNGGVVYKKRTTVKDVLARQDDIALWLEASSLRMEAPVPGRPYIGVETPIKNPRVVTFNEIIHSNEFQAACKKSRLAVALGWNISNQICVADIRKMPHLLIAGTTGAGKSIFLKTLLSGIIQFNTPDDVRLALVDPKLVELGMFNGIPHLLSPVVTEMEKVLPLLQNAVDERERRYRHFSKVGVTSLEQYNKLHKAKTVAGDSSLPNYPAIVIVIDELADLMETVPDDIEGYIQRLAQKARATGIHLVFATQRPSVDVITGTIKANFPARIAFKVSSGIDSRTILDKKGAESLNGRGDMLYQGPDTNGSIRIQAPFIEDDVVKALVQYWIGEIINHIAGSENAENPIDPVKIHQSTLWQLEPVEAIEGEKGGQSRKKTVAFTEEQLYEHLTEYLLKGTLQPTGTPIPVLFRTLAYEDQLLVAEAITWRNERGSAENLNRKLNTKKGAELRDALRDRGLMNGDTQLPIRPSQRLIPLLIESGIIDAETHERFDAAQGEDQEALTEGEEDIPT